MVSGTQVQRSVFPNNVIPPSRLNPVALNYLKYYPQPDTPGRIDGFQNKIVIGTRLKRTGMHWTVNGANAIIALRCSKLSGRFEDFWERRRDRVAA